MAGEGGCGLYSCTGVGEITTSGYWRWEGHGRVGVATDRAHMVGVAKLCKAKGIGYTLKMTGCSSSK